MTIKQNFRPLNFNRYLIDGIDIQTQITIKMRIIFESMRIITSIDVFEGVEGETPIMESKFNKREKYSALTNSIKK